MHKGRRYGSPFPQVKTKLAPEVNLQWYSASSEHPPGATLAPDIAGSPLYRGLWKGELRGSAMQLHWGSLARRTDTEKLEKLQAEECNSLGLQQRTAEGPLPRLCGS